MNKILRRGFALNTFTTIETSLNAYSLLISPRYFIRIIIDGTMSNETFDFIYNCKTETKNK